MVKPIPLNKKDRLTTPNEQLQKDWEKIPFNFIKTPLLLF